MGNDVMAEKWFANARIMAQWDRWRKYIAEGGRASWPRDEFECLLDTHDAEVEALRADRQDWKRQAEHMHALADRREMERDAHRAKLTTLRARVETMEGVLLEAQLQLAYMDLRSQTGTTPAVVAKITAALSPQPKEVKP